MTKEIKTLKEKLNEEYLNIFEQIEYRISTEFYNESKLREVKKDILGIFIEGQERGLKVNEVVGNDLESFCLEILKDNKANHFLFGLKLVIMMITIFSFMILISGVYDMLLDGYQNLYYDSEKEATVVHYIPRNLTLMLDKALITQSIMMSLIIIGVNVLIWKNAFKFKSLKKVQVIFSFVSISGTTILGRILSNNFKTLEDFLEVKISLIGIVFIFSSLIYFGISKYRSRKLI